LEIVVRWWLIVNRQKDESIKFKVESGKIKEQSSKLKD